jgi:hypothetical protein
MLVVVGIERARFDFNGGRQEGKKGGALCYAVLYCAIVLWLC